MTNVIKVLEREVNGLKVNLFEYDIESEESVKQIRDYLVKKVSISNVHDISEYDLTYYGTQNLKPEFVARFNEQISQINIPKKSIVPQFDVRRERITELKEKHTEMPITVENITRLKGIISEIDAADYKAKNVSGKVI